MKNKNVMILSSILIFTLFSSNVVYANEAYIGLEESEAQETDMQVIEDLTIDSIEIDGYNKVFDSDTGMYIFVYDEDSIETITNNYEDYAETNNTNALATALPDLTAEITSPINNSNIMGAKNSEDKCSFNFRVINQGNESSAYEGHNFFCEIYINGTAQLGFLLQNYLHLQLLPENLI
ncbi:MAG: hypothetical protein PUD43_04555 [Clostridia bacterium]|nr:hypothetical protein [Clostridia bacterium]